MPLDRRVDPLNVLWGTWRRKLTQRQLAALIGSTQPRVANLERGSASLDMLTRTLLSLGASREDVSEHLAA